MPLLNSLATPYADALLQVTDSRKESEEEGDGGGEREDGRKAGGLVAGEDEGGADPAAVCDSPDGSGPTRALRISPCHALHA